MWCLRTVIIAALVLSAAAARAQSLEGDDLRVFLDCDRRCDFTFLRQTIPWIAWVTDRQVSEVHLLVTTQGIGGIEEYTLEFIGHDAFAGRDQILRFTAGATDTAEERRRNLARLVRIGLARYAAETSAGAALDVQPLAARRPPAGRSDRWNGWIFSLGVDGTFTGEQRTQTLSVSPSLVANRTTSASRLSARVDGSYAASTFEFADGTAFSDVSRTMEAGFQFVRTVGRHWGAGVGAQLQRSTYFNLAPSYRSAAALEFNLFPYSESSQRALTVTYFAGTTRFRYAEATIFNRLEEMLANQGLLVKFDTRRPWGSTSVDVQARNYLQEPEQYRVTASGAVDYRITRGVGVTFSATYSRIRDQRYLAKRGASEEQILLRRRALATGASAAAFVGVSYTFGSIFNGTVNSRLTGAGGRFERLF